MPDAECIHDLAPGTCSTCTGRGEELPPERDRSALGVPFPARYPGRCAWGDERISEGDMIRAIGAADYVCEECWS
jgi:hypothetical protein